MTLKLLSDNKSFNGNQQVYSHYSTVCKCDMTFGLFLPKVIGPKKIPLLWFLSGLTCTHENAMTKAGAQQWAAKRGIALVFPDTSPRGETVPDHADFDLGQGAGFYLDASNPSWSNHFNMETYIKDELSAYNPLVPNGKELTATLMFEIDNPVSRATFLGKVGGIEERVFMKVDDEIIKAVPEEDVDRTSAEGKASSVQFIHFNFTDDQINKFRSNSTEIELGIDHKEYSHSTKLSKENILSLSADFS